jgi:DNA polymerase-1
LFWLYQVPLRSDGFRATPVNGDRFDLGLPTFRHEADDTYKADRPETPEDFIPDLKNLQELLQALKVPVVTSPGYEADDVLATLCQQASETGYRVKILTGDRDLFQLVDPQKEISVLYLSTDFFKGRGSTGPIEIGSEQVKEKLGISPAQVVDYKALCGDKSDNIPGVKGIGDKTAVTLLNEYGSLEGIYASLDKIKGATKTKLEAGKELAEHSRYLAQLKFDAPVDIELEDAKLEGFDTEVLKPLLEQLELKRFLGKIDQLQKTFGGRVVEETPTPVEVKASAPLQSESVEAKPARPHRRNQKMVIYGFLVRLIPKPPSNRNRINLSFNPLLLIRQKNSLSWSNSCNAALTRQFLLLGTRKRVI